MNGWLALVATLDGVTRQNLQTAYAGLQKSLHQQCAFMQRIISDIGVDFQVVEDMLQDIFLPALFQGGTSQIPGGRLPVFQSNRMGSPSPNRFGLKRRIGRHPA